MSKQNLFKHLLSILAVVSITSFAGVGASYAAGDEAVSAGGEVPEENTAEQKEKCEKSGGTWGGDVCECTKANTVEKDGMCVCKDGYKLDGAESLGEENAKCVVDENSGTGSTETPTGDDPVGAVTGIKIATKSFNDARFSYVRRDLDNTIATIRDVVSNAITNTNNIAALQDGKQTRPDDNHACETGKTCLLVTDTSGTRNWYEIIDCNEHAFFSNMGNGIGAGASGGKYCANGYVSSASGYRDCASNEWGHLYENGMVYGEARAVAIAEAPGAVVTLPNNVAVGDTCVCRVTGYAPLVSGTIAGRNAVYASTPTSFTTDEWVVGGKISTHYTGAPGTAMTDANCIDVCGFDSGDDGALKSMYFASISNTCMASASEAQMCRYYPFFATVASVGEPEHRGMVTGDSGVVDCQTGEYFAGNSHCSTNGSWIVEYENANGIMGYVYGTVGYATVPSGAAIGDVVDLDISTVSTTGSAGDNAIVCVAKGYKTASDASETNVSLNKVLVVMVGDYSNGTDASNASRYCMDSVGYMDYANFDDGMNWYNQLSNICVAY